jgi:hypothetical protein
MASFARAENVLEPVRSWPDPTMRAKVRVEMPGSETAAPSHDHSRGNLVRKPSLTAELESNATN